jgi:hypothetical protein
MPLSRLPQRPLTHEIPTPTHPQVRWSQGVPCSATLDCPCRVTEPTLSGTDVSRQLLTLKRHSMSTSQRQPVKKIVIQRGVMRFTSRFICAPQSLHTISDALQQAFARLGITADHILQSVRQSRTQPRRCRPLWTHPGAGMATKKAPALAGAFGFQKRLPASADRRRGLTYGVRTAFRVTPEYAA